jgi:hypothetical protein
MDRRFYRGVQLLCITHGTFVFYKQQNQYYGKESSSQKTGKEESTLSFSHHGETDKKGSGRQKPGHHRKRKAEVKAVVMFIYLGVVLAIVIALAYKAIKEK